MPHSAKAKAEWVASASIFAALGDETRLRLVSRLCDQGPMMTRLGTCNCSKMRNGGLG